MSGETAHQTLGPYHLLESIGQGGMAEVFSAEIAGADGTKRRVALKILHPQLAANNPEFVEMLADEAKVAVRLHHPNIVQSFELGCIDGKYFISMEHIDGPDLLSLLTLLGERGQALPVGAALFIAQQILRGLAYAHRLADERGASLGLIHRDISPPNVLLSHGGEVKLADFGIAKATQLPGKTQAGIIKGKLEYMSPEQLSGKPLDQRSDIFSAGVVIHETLTNQPLYGGLSQIELISAVRHPVFKPPSSIRSDLPPAIDEILRLALAKEPQDRWPTADAFAQALSTLLESWQAGYDAAMLGSVLRTVLAGAAPDGPAAAAAAPPIGSIATVDAMRPEDFVVHDHAIIVEVDRTRGFEGYDQPTVVDMRAVAESERAARIADGPTLIVEEETLAAVKASLLTTEPSTEPSPLASAATQDTPADCPGGGGQQPVKTSFVCEEDLLRSLAGPAAGAEAAADAPAAGAKARAGVPAAGAEAAAGAPVASHSHDQPTRLLEPVARTPSTVRARSALALTPVSAPTPRRGLGLLVVGACALLAGAVGGFFGPRLLGARAGAAPAAGTERVVTTAAGRNVRHGSWQLRFGTPRVDSATQQLLLPLQLERGGTAAPEGRRYLFVQLAAGRFAAAEEGAASAAELTYRLAGPLPAGELRCRFAPPDAPSLQLRLPRGPK